MALAPQEDACATVISAFGFRCSMLGVFLQKSEALRSCGPGVCCHGFALAFQIVITSADPCERTPLSFKISSVALTISAEGKTIDAPLVRVLNSKVTNSSSKSRTITTKC